MVVRQVAHADFLSTVSHAIKQTVNDYFIVLSLKRIDASLPCDE